MRSIIAFIILGIFGLLVAGCKSGTQVATTVSDKDTTPTRKLSVNENPKRFYGPESAKVNVVCFYPLNEKHLKIVDFLNKEADKYPGKVNVTAWDFRTEQGGAECQKAFGKICGGILINGKTDFKVTLKGKPADVTTLGGEWVSWTKPEVTAALAKVVKEKYPEAAGPAKK